MNKYLFLFLFLGLTNTLHAAEDKKEPAKDVYKKATVMKAVKANMKAANYSKVLEEINKAFNKYDEAKADAELHDIEVKALEQQVLAENRNMYLATRPDTTKYFNYIYEMYNQALICDSLEQMPDAEGKTSIKYRYANAATLIKYRQNLKVSCKFFYKKKDYKNAYKFVDLYCKTKSANIFTGKKGDFTLPEEKDSTEMAVMAVVSAYGSQNNKGVVNYLKGAMNDARKYKFLELGCKSYMALGDTINAIECAKKGFTENQEQEFFFMTLVKYYGDKDDHKACLDVAKKMVGKFDKNRNYWFIKAKQEELLGLEDDAIESHKKAIENKEDDAEAYSSIGNIYTNKAQRLYKNNSLSVTDHGYKQFKTDLDALYTKAKDAYESARKYAPTNKPLWLEGLRTTYFHLNKGKELKELEKN